MQPEWDINTGYLFDVSFLGKILWQQRFSFAEIKQCLLCLLLIQLKRNQCFGLKFSFQLFGQYGWIAAEGTECRNRFLIRDKLCTAVWTEVTLLFCAVLLFFLLLLLLLFLFLFSIVLFQVAFLKRA